MRSRKLNVFAYGIMFHSVVRQKSDKCQRRQCHFFCSQRISQ